MMTDWRDEWLRDRGYKMTNSMRRRFRRTGIHPVDAIAICDMVAEDQGVELDPAEAMDSIERLINAGLISVSPDGAYTLLDPRTRKPVGGSL